MIFNPRFRRIWSKAKDQLLEHAGQKLDSEANTLFVLRLGQKAPLGRNQTDFGRAGQKGARSGFGESQAFLRDRERNPDGRFIGALNNYRTLDIFEDLLQAHAAIFTPSTVFRESNDSMLQLITPPTTPARELRCCPGNRAQSARSESLCPRHSAFLCPNPSLQPFRDSWRVGSFPVTRSTVSRTISWILAWSKFPAAARSAVFARRPRSPWLPIAYAFSLISAPTDADRLGRQPDRPNASHVNPALAAKARARVISGVTLNVRIAATAPRKFLTCTTAASAH